MSRPTSTRVFQRSAEAPSVISYRDLGATFLFTFFVVCLIVFVALIGEAIQSKYMEAFIQVLVRASSYTWNGGRHRLAQLARWWNIGPGGPECINPASGTDRRDIFSTNALCPVCLNMVNSSWLLRAPPWGLVTASEQLEFHHNVAHLRASADSMCHLCSLLWHILKSDSKGVLSSEEGSRQTEPDYVAGIVDEETPLNPVQRHKKLSVQVSKRRRYSKRDGRLYSVLTMHLKRGEEYFGKSLLIRSVRQKPTFSTRDLPASTGSKATLQRIRTWIDTCRQTHVSCTRNQSTTLPTRLLFVGNTKEPDSLRLHYPAQDDEMVEYLALSHCWGGARITNLTLENHAQLSRHIEINSLPQNFRDAIYMSRELGVSFLWVDSLCIIQDSPDDWFHESERMNDVYSNAVCTIAATASRDPSGGCFRRRNPLMRLPLLLLKSGTGAMPLRVEIPGVDTEQLLVEDVERSPLNQRGWAFQERALSTRVVHFGNNAAIFECDETYTSDLEPEGHASRRTNTLQAKQLEQDVPNVVDDAQPQTHLTNEGAEIQYTLEQQEQPVQLYNDAIMHPGSLKIIEQFNDADIQNRLEFNQRWYASVKAYTARELTRKEDRLIALSGVADRISQLSGLSYVVGLWEENIVYNLLWVAVGDLSDRRLDFYKAPTWSWASVNGPVDHLFSVGKSICDRATNFHPDQLSRWAGLGEEATLIRCIGPSGKQPAGTTLSYDYSIELTAVWLTKVIIQPDFTFKALDGSSITFGYYPDTKLDMSSSPLTYLARLCEHIADLTVCHGLVLRACPTNEASSESPFERIGCFRIDGDIDVVFKNAVRRTIRIV